MTEKINVEAILNKHGIIEGHTLHSNPNDINKELKTAIKEILEAVVDKCAESSLLLVTPYDQEEYTNTNIKSDWANKEHIDGFEVDVSQQSILQVKQQIDYE
jgi:hypothetical protein